MAMKTGRGFTLIEMIVAMVLTAIVAGMISIFIARPVEGYIDSARRAELSDVADLALKRITLEVRDALANSVRTTTSRLEFVPVRSVGRYCSVDCPAGIDDLSFGSNGGSWNTFAVLGPAVSLESGDFLVINNKGEAATSGCNGTDVYAGCNRRLLNGASTSTWIRFDGNRFENEHASYNNLFQIVPGSGPIQFVCNGTEIRRYTGYGWSGTVSGTGALLARADAITCSFTFDRDLALLTLTITLTRQGETVRLWQQINVNSKA